MSLRLGIRYLVAVPALILAGFGVAAAGRGPTSDAELEGRFPSDQLTKGWSGTTVPRSAAALTAADVSGAMAAAPGSSQTTRAAAPAQFSSFWAARKLAVTQALRMSTPVPASNPRSDPQSRVRPDDRSYSFYFSRGAYRGVGNSWATDAPTADQWIVGVMQRLTNIDIYPAEHFIRLDDPELRRFPFLYLLEVGRMRLSDEEIDGLRSYLLQGGFAMVDDFWGTYEWANWEEEISRVLPEYPIVEIPLTHGIFSTMYKVNEIVQVPNVNNAQRGQTYEQDGFVPHVRGIFDEKGRLMMVINWNTDLGDAWEWAEASYYPLEFSTYAYQVAANTFMYAMTH
jgi:hypothetical protein